jgi:hypothetical protein
VKPFLTLIISFILLVASHATAQTVSPPVKVKGQQATGYQVPKPNLQIPNKQATNLGGQDVLLETGNANLLDNPSFENFTSNSGWTLTAGTFVSDNSPIAGKQNAQLTMAAQSLEFYQDSTLYASQFADGVQGLAGAWVRTSITSTPIYVCPRQAGVSASVTSGCVQVAANGKWGYYKAPFTLGATSNGIAIHSNAVAITGDVEVDEVFVGAVSVIQDIDASKLAGALRYGASASCLWTSTAASASAFAADTDCATPTVEGQVSAPGTKIPAITLNGPAGEYVVNFSGKIGAVAGAATTAACTFYVNDGTTTGDGTLLRTNATGATAVEIDTPRLMFRYKKTSASPVTISLYSATPAGGTRSCNIDASSNALNIEAYYFTNNSSYSAICGANCVDTFSANVNGTSSDAVSAENIDWLPSNCTDATTGESTCTFNSNIFTVAPNCTCTQVTGASAADQTCSINAISSTSITFQTTSNGALADRAVTLSCQKQGADFNATRMIVGFFKGLMTVPNISKPKTCYYRFGGASATLAAPTECTAGTCVEVEDSCGAITPPTYSSDGVYINLTVANGTFANSSSIDCSCKAYDTTAGTAAVRPCNMYFDTGDSTWAANSSGGAVLNMQSTTTGGVAANSYISVKCEGQEP